MCMGLILKPFFGIAVNAAVLYVLMRIVPEITYTGGYMFFIVGGAVLGLINALVRPLLKILSLPFIFITGGLFLIVINMGILWLFGYFLEVAAFQGVSLDFPNFGTYVIGAIVFGIANWAFNLIK